MNTNHHGLISILAAVIAVLMPVNSMPIDRFTERKAGTFSVPRSAAEAEILGKPKAPDLGVTFEKNVGQVDSSVLFICRTGGLTTYLTTDSALLNTGLHPRSGRVSVQERAVSPMQSKEDLKLRSHQKVTEPQPVRMAFLGAHSDPNVSGETPLEGKVNYLRGSDPSKWITDVPTYGSVRYRGLLDGVDVVYYGNAQGELEYDLEVDPGADASDISLQFSGANGMSIDSLTGDLVLGSGDGEIRHKSPVAFQVSNGVQRPVAARYALTEEGRLSFKLGHYNRNLPVTIDPVISYSSFLGGMGDIDVPSGLAVDAAGNTYITGSTNSADFPTIGALDSTFGGDQFRYDAYVTKVNPAGTGIVYSTYLGGTGDDNGVGIAVDSSGQAFVTGFTNSTNFPTTAGSFQTALNGVAYDGFLAKLSASGSALTFASYLGGSGNDAAYSVAVDGAGSAYITGETASTNFPVVGAFQNTFKGGTSDAFVTKFSPTGNALASSTFVGGAGEDIARGIAVDASGIYLAGGTNSGNYPVANAAQGALGSAGFYDAFVTKLSATGAAVTYSTFLGGNDYDFAAGIAVDAGGNAHITGGTSSLNFPRFVAQQAAFGGGAEDAFITKLGSEGAIVYSTYLGGNGIDYGSAITVDSAGRAHVTGSTSSANFPIVAASQIAYGGQTDAFVTKYSEAGSALIFSTYLGGSSADDGTAIAADTLGNVFVAGITDSANFTVLNPFQSSRRGVSDGFILKLISSVTVSGRTLGSDGRPLRGAIVSLTGPDGIRRQVSSTALGFFTFENVEAGQTYTLTVSSKRFRYSPETFTPTNNAINFDLIGQE